MEVSHEQTYKELAMCMNEHGLFRRAYVYYLSFFALLYIGAAFSLWVMVVTDNPWIQVANAVFLAFVFVQASTLAHDCSHKQAFQSDKINRLAAKIIFGIFMGMSEGWWFAKHNLKHHARPNQVGQDPDLYTPFLFSEKQFVKQPRWKLFFIKRHQHIIFFIVLPYVYFVFLYWSWKYAIAQFHRKKNALELVCMALHFLFFGFFIFYFLPLSTATLFVIINVLATGLYMRIIFTPNHKGEMILSHDEAFSWIHQITTARNIKPSWLVFHLTGGLNFQIEHHLFPSMPRPSCWKARLLVKEYCTLHNIPYHETSFFGSLVEIYIALKKISGIEFPLKEETYRK